MILLTSINLILIIVDNYSYIVHMNKLLLLSFHLFVNSLNNFLSKYEIAILYSINQYIFNLYFNIHRFLLMQEIQIVVLFLSILYFDCFLRFNFFSQN